MKLNIQMFADGEVIIPVNLDTEGFDKDLELINKKLQKKKLDIEMAEDNVRKAKTNFDDLNKTLTETEEKINENKNKVKELTNELAKIKSNDAVLQREGVFDPSTVSAHKMSSGYYDIESKISAINSETDTLVTKMNQYAPATEKASINLDKANKQLEKQKLDYDTIIAKQKQNNDITKQSKVGFKSIGTSIDKVVSKVTRWGLAVIGVRSAYSGIRQAISLVTSHNKKIAGQIDTMKMAIANALLPIVKTIVQFIAKIMQMIDYVYFRLTGKHLFDFSKAFKDAKKNAQGTAKATKDIRKNLAGFDEMNILSDNTASAGGGAGTRFDNPFEGWEKFKAPEWLDKIVNILRWCKDNLPLVAGAVTLVFGAIKIAKIMSLVSKLGTGGLLGILVALDTILVGTIIVTIKKKLLPLIKETNDQIEKTIEMTQGRKKTTEKLTEATLKNAKSEKENTEATARNIDYMLKSIDSHKKENKELLDQTSLTGMLTGENKLHRETIKANNEETDAYLETLDELYDLQKLTPQQVETYSQALAEEIHRLEIANRNLGQNTQEYKDNADKINTLKNNLNKLPDSVTSKIKIDANTKPARQKIEDLLKDIGKAGIDGALGLQTSVASAIKVIKNRKGGIINLPSRGVPLNIGGEAGQEGIVPLTDSQQMALLGEAIGRYITINAQITNTMNGRVISRELQKIQQENSFASNR